MNLQDDLEDAITLVRHCGSIPEISKARMNFVVNLVTILEIHSRHLLQNCFDDSFLEGSFTCNTILRAVIDEEQKRVVRQLVRLRNKFIHEGKTLPIDEELIASFYSVASSIISNTKLIETAHGSGYEEVP